MFINICIYISMYIDNWLLISVDTIILWLLKFNLFPLLFNWTFTLETFFELYAFIYTQTYVYIHVFMYAYRQLLSNLVCMYVQLNYR